mmetsp:Transcript_1106/g.2169  ORF Transcript_1106/g.2169 Transcript_1106/m.2169 type:complete len:140 (+) Transcript_1106:209-628(+)
MTVDDQMRDEALLETALLQSYLEFMEQSANTADDSDRAESRREQAKLESTPPATPEMLRLLPILQLRDEDLEVNPECCICLEEYETGKFTCSCRLRGVVCLCVMIWACAATAHEFCHCHQSRFTYWCVAVEVLLCRLCI